ILQLFVTPLSGILEMQSCQPCVMTIVGRFGLKLASAVEATFTHWLFVASHRRRFPERVLPGGLRPVLGSCPSVLGSTKACVPLIWGMSWNPLMAAVSFPPPTEVFVRVIWPLAGATFEKTT